MNTKQIAKRYSRLMIDTVDMKDIPNVLKELSAFSNILETDRRLRIFFSSRIFSDEERDTAIKDILEHFKFSEEGRKFILRIVKQGHVQALKDIIKALTTAYNEKLKKAKAVVISPVSLDTGYIERLKEVLKRLTQKEIEIEKQIDPSLIGGFIVKVGSTIYDSSLRAQLRLLKMAIVGR